LPEPYDPCEPFADLVSWHLKPAAVVVAAVVAVVVTWALAQL